MSHGHGYDSTIELTLFINSLKSRIMEIILLILEWIGENAGGF